MMHRVFTLTEAEKAELASVLALDPRSDTLDEVLTKIDFGSVAAWRPWAAPNALVLTQIIIWPRGRELALLYMFGEGILKVAHMVVEDLEVLAEHNDCCWLTADGFSKAWPKLAAELGFRPMQTSYLKELAHG